MANIHDVAKAAGVSISTVSYALSGKRSIGDETRKRISDAVQSLGYRPNAGARMLASTKTNILALSAPLRSDTYAPAHMAFVLAVVQAARVHDYDVLLLTEDEATGGLDRVAASNLVDGVIVLDVAAKDERIDVLRSIRTSSVLVGVPDDTDGLVCVDLDFRASAKLAVDTLTEAGHTSIGLLGQPAEIYARGSNFPLRFRSGFENAIEAAGVSSAFAMPGPNGAKAALGELFEALPEMTGLILNCEEPLQERALEVLNEQGLSIPDDMAVISACSSFDTSRLTPPLDVIPLVAADSCIRAVELAVAQLIDEIEPRVELLEPRYIDYGSVSPLH